MIPGSGRSPGGGNGNPLQYSCLGNPKFRGVWRVIVLGVAKSRTRLSNCASILANCFWLYVVFAALCGLSLVAASGCLLLVVVHGLLIVVASLVAVLGEAC